MLRNAKQVRHAPLSKWSRALIILSFVGVSLIVAGLRGPVGLTTGLAQAQATRPASRQPFDLSYLPSQSSIVLGIRAADLNALPEMKPLVAFANEQLPVKIEPADVEQLLQFWLPLTDDPAAPAPGEVAIPRLVSGFVVRATQPQDWKRATAAFVKDPEEVRFEGQVYVRPKSSSLAFSYFAPDAKTIIMGREHVLQGIMKVKPNSKATHAWDRVWKTAERGQVAIAFDSSWLQLMARRDPGAYLNGHVRPALGKSRAFALGADVSQGIRVEGQVDCNSAEDAKRIARTVDAAVTAGRNALENLRELARDQGKEVAPLPRVLANVLEPLLKDVRVRVEETGGANTVQFESTSDMKTGRAIQELPPTIAFTRLMAGNAQSRNNLRQIALAMHNFHSANGHFPPAVLMGPDGKTPYSWRIAILPYLDRDDLYKQYHFDGPWDGPHNRKLIDQIPTPYHFPGAKDEASNASYFVFTGPGTLFSEPNGTAMQSVFDGTSLTVLVVEAKREIPWTKPEDIAFVREGLALPELEWYTPGGGNVAFADGAVKFLAKTVNVQVLKAMITPAGGEVLVQPIPGISNEPPDAQ